MELKTVDKLNVLSSFPKSMSISDWDSKIKSRGIDFKPPEQLKDARICYEKKIPLLKKQIEAEKDLIELTELNNKLKRLEEKYACICTEEAYRDANLVERIYHHTIYYIDLANGNDSNDGLTTGNAWKTIAKYTSVTVRSPGDIAYVRANTTETLTATVNFDEDGTWDNPISIIGCDATVNDPWNDDSDVRPIWDFNGGTYYFYTNGDHYWQIKRMDVRNSKNNAYGNWRFASGLDWTFTDCIFRDAERGIQVTDHATFISCQFTNNSGYDVFNTSAIGDFYGCVFNSAGGAFYTYLFRVQDCTFGNTTPHSVICYVYAPYIYAIRNSIFNSTLVGTGSVSGAAYRSVLIEDYGGVKGAQYSSSNWGEVLRDSTIQIDSLASAKLTPVAATVTNTPGLSINNFTQWYDFALWLDATEHTITLKARETEAWAADPNPSEFFIEASYLNHATNATRSRVQSTQSLNGTNEVSFTVTFTPSAEGWVYLQVYLKDYEDGKSVNVSVKPVVT